jgi:transcriptional regulator with XRE-family HTH domain
MRRFGTWIVREREKYGLTQQQLADAIDVQASTLSSWETGNSNPQERNRQKVKAFFAEVEAPSTAKPMARKLPSNPTAPLNVVSLP